MRGKCCISGYPLQKYRPPLSSTLRVTTNRTEYRLKNFVRKKTTATKKKERKKSSRRSDFLFFREKISLGSFALFHLSKLYIYIYIHINICIYIYYRKRVTKEFFSRDEVIEEMDILDGFPTSNKYFSFLSFSSYSF